MKIQKSIYLLSLLFCLFPFVETPFALLLGIVLAQTVEHPFLIHSQKLTHIILKASVVGLGFGMNAIQAIEIGEKGFLFTVFSITATILLGVFVGKQLKVEKKTSYLISSGTAICGGSAIAAISPIIKSNDKQITTALGIVFILNSVALFVFPFIGHQLNLTQYQFGVWAAIAIHDTSSVVGAAAQYGTTALQTATTIKLERSLWIIPVAMLTLVVFKNKTGKIRFPYFILFFIFAMMINTFLPEIHPVSTYIVAFAKSGLKVSLFLIGTGLSGKLIKSIGFRPLIQGIMIWIFISIASLISVLCMI
jgi:uncharacterized integral membrane protein (TIGR00698 family)